MLQMMANPLGCQLPEQTNPLTRPFLPWLEVMLRLQHHSRRRPGWVWEAPRDTLSDPGARLLHLLAARFDARDESLGPACLLTNSTRRPGPLFCPCFSPWARPDLPLLFSFVGFIYPPSCGDLSFQTPPPTDRKTEATRVALNTNTWVALGCIRFLRLPLFCFSYCPPLQRAFVEVVFRRSLRRRGPALSSHRVRQTPKPSRSVWFFCFFFEACFY